MLSIALSGGIVLEEAVDLLSDRLLMMMMNDKFLVFGIRLYMTVVPPFYKVS